MEVFCPKCDGQRLGPIARNVILESRENKQLSLPELLSLPPSKVADFITSLKVKVSDKPILQSIIPEITERLGFMKKLDRIPYT